MSGPIKKGIPGLPAVSRAVFESALKARGNYVLGPSGHTDSGGMIHIPVHNSGARKPNFPSGGGV